MGGIGSSSAIEASDVVIMTDELNKIVDGIEISKKTNKIIIQNLIFAIGCKNINIIIKSIWNSRYVASCICRCWYNFDNNI